MALISNEDESSNLHQIFIFNMLEIYLFLLADYQISSAIIKFVLKEENEMKKENKIEQTTPTPPPPSSSAHTHYILKWWYIFLHHQRHLSIMITSNIENIIIYLSIYIYILEYIGISYKNNIKNPNNIKNVLDKL